VPNQFVKKVDMIAAVKIAQTIVFEQETSVTNLERASYPKSLNFGLQLMLNRLQ
jgi:hypothetical protein